MIIKALQVCRMKATEYETEADMGHQRLKDLLGSDDLKIVLGTRVKCYEGTKETCEPKSWFSSSA